MIFVTVGTQLPFDRLIIALDEYFEGSASNVYAQIGGGDFKPKNISFSDFLSPVEADELFRKSSLIISHAGMGSILTALKYRKPIFVLPRKASLGEHRNEHQTATANWVKSLNGVTVAENENDLIKLISNSSVFDDAQNISEYADERLIDFLYKQINL